MFQDDAFEKLKLDQVATILDRVNSLLDGVDFDPVSTIILRADVSFYPGFYLLDILNHDSVPPAHRFVLTDDKQDIILDFTNEPIYRLNKDLPITLNEQNVSDYVRFFFTYVRGRHGRFLICETVEDIDWRDDPPPAAKATIGKMLKPLILKESESSSSYEMTATMIFKDSLFKSDLSISSDGFVTLSNEELLVEDMPVLDDVFGQ